MWSAARVLFSVSTISSITLTKAIRTNPNDAHRADKPAGPIEALAAAALVAECNAKCIPQCAPSVAKTPKYRSNPEATGPYIAAIASGSSANVAAAVRIDTKLRN